jgi:hypothetical protein
MQKVHRIKETQFSQHNLVFRGEFHPQFWICLTHTSTVPLLLVIFFIYIIESCENMICKSVTSLIDTQFYEIVPNFYRFSNTFKLGMKQGLDQTTGSLKMYLLVLKSQPQLNPFVS